MIIAKGTFQAPLFTQKDLVEIEVRGEAGYGEADDSRFGQINVRHLCRVIRAEGKLLREDWHRIREWSRELSSESQAQQLKTDLFRLLKFIQVDDTDEPRARTMEQT